MKIMYRADINTCDYCGRGNYWDDIRTEYFATIEEAEVAGFKATEGIDEKDYDFRTGHWRLVEVTMDEKTFTYTEKIVKTYNYRTKEFY